MLIIFASSPYGTSKAREGLDISLAFSSFIDGIKVLFIGEGILNLKIGQNPNLILQRDHSKTFRLFDLCEINDVYVIKSDLDRYGLLESDLSLKVKVISIQEAFQIVSNSNKNLVF